MPLQLNEKERLFINDFPGKVRRFSDDHREYIVRWVTSSTRKLHPASDCLRGVGYRIKPMPIETRSDNNQWSVFLADRSGERLRVYERIYDNYGNSWTDVSAWYWAALLGKSRGPWWSVTIAEKDR
ncbi:MAG: hypothetical protein GY794_13230 [bacterium]|nr:hypothetical protein [bacterium]